MAKSEDTFRAVAGNWRCMVVYLILCCYSLGTSPNPRAAVTYASWAVALMLLVLFGLRWRIRSLFWRYLALTAIALYITWDGLLPV
jgi:hypothetical protein